MYNVAIRFKPEMKANPDERHYYGVEIPYFDIDADSVVIHTDQTPKKVAVFHWRDILEVLSEEVE